jgi:hypothetical protein
MLPFLDCAHRLSERGLSQEIKEILKTADWSPDTDF